MEQVWQTVAQYQMLETGDRVLLGVSGGPDSVALLHLLRQRMALYGIQLFVVHINHQLRPEAAEEAAYVEQLADAYGLPFRLFSVDVSAYAAAHGQSLEQAGHALRFACFAEAATAWQANKLALGHHRDDRAESLLLHLIQGCGLDGLAAMPPKAGWLIRPLAAVGKQQLIAYCKAHGLRYYVDGTNLEPGCLRNQIRLELLPQLKTYNPQMVSALLRLQDSCAMDVDFLEQYAVQLWRQHGCVEDDSVSLSAEVLRGQHVAIQRRLLREMYGALVGSSTDLTFHQTEAMRRLAWQRAGSQRLALHGGLQFVRQYDQLLLRRAAVSSVSQSFCHAWKHSEFPEIAAGHWRLTVQEATTPVTPNKRWAVVDCDQLADVLEVRSRRPGDVVRLAGKGGRQTLKKFMIGRKIPAEQRDQLPLVLSDGEIVWIPGYFLADCIKITERTKHTCLLQCFQK